LLGNFKTSISFPLIRFRDPPESINIRILIIKHNGQLYYSNYENNNLNNINYNNLNNLNNYKNVQFDNLNRPYQVSNNDLNRNNLKNNDLNNNTTNIDNGEKKH